MNKEVKNHLIPLIIVYIFISFFWLFFGNNYFSYIALFLGLATGAFLLDIDHFFYWFYLDPNTDEWEEIKNLVAKKKYPRLIKFFFKKHHQHNNLLFHHFLFQVFFTIISIFIYAGTKNIFILSLVLSLNIHLLVNELEDYYQKPVYLQEWLFAREPKKLPVEYLHYYLIPFIIINIIFIFIIARILS